MDLQERLDKAKQKQKDIVNEVNALDNQRQQLIQEAIRLEGTISTLAELKKD